MNEDEQKILTRYADLQRKIAQLEDLGTSERHDAIDDCLSGIQGLSEEVIGATSYLPAYDVRMYNERIKALQDKLKEVRASFAPRPRFAFKSGLNLGAKKNASAISLADAAELAAQRKRPVPGYQPSGESSLAVTPAGPGSPERQGTSDAQPDGGGHDADPTTNLMKINGHQGAHILQRGIAETTRVGTMSNLNRCVVEMGLPTSTDEGLATLTLKNISHSIILCGRVDGPIHLTNVRSSIIVVACRQFRMHESHDTKVYLDISSRPIIEDCSGIGFAPLPARLATESTTSDNNLWREVDDFKWLRSEPSPNWSVLESTIDDAVWTKVVSKHSSLDVDDTLQSFGIGS